MVKEQTNKTNKFSIYLSILFLGLITTATLYEYFALKLVVAYWSVSMITYLWYAWDKSSAKKNRWRTAESTLHFLSFACGWPGAALAQQHLRHKSQKKAFRSVYWFTVFMNLAALTWLHTTYGAKFLTLLY